MENALLFELMATARRDELRRFADRAAPKPWALAPAHAAGPSEKRGLRPLLARLLLAVALKMDRAAAINRLSAHQT